MGGLKLGGVILLLTDGEKAAELAENQDSGEIKVTQDEVQGDGWTEYVV